MLDTVPKETKLTEVIRPLPVKPAGIEVVPTEGGGLALQGDVRVCDSTLVSRFADTRLVLGHARKSCTSSEGLLGRSHGQYV
jgi:hypothetical protein